MSASLALLAIGIALPCLGAQATDTTRPTRETASMPFVAGTCTNCHGPQGRSAGAVPSLAGLPQRYLVEQMKAFREGKRPATIMHQIAKGYSEDESAALAEYFARQPAR